MDLRVHFLVFFNVAFTAFERFLRATKSLKRSKSFISDLTFFALSFFAHAVSCHFARTPSLSMAAFKVFSRAPRGMVTLKSVRLKRLMGIMWRRTPVVLSGPSTTTRFWSTISTIVHILPAQGPYVIRARRPGSTKRVYIAMVALYCETKCTE